MKPNIKQKSRIGRDKFKEEIAFLKRKPETNIKDILFYKYPGKKTNLVLEDRFDVFKVINLKRFTEIFLKQKGKKDLKRKSTLFYFQRSNSSKKEFTSALPKASYFIDSLFKFKTTKHGYEVITILNPENKVLGYTTIKINREYMQRVENRLEKHKEKGESLLKVRNRLNRIILNKLSKQKSLKKENLELNFYKLLLSLGFKVYFTPEAGYKLDKNFNFIPDKK